MADYQLKVSRWLEAILADGSCIKFNAANHYFLQHESGQEIRITVSDSHPFVLFYAVVQEALSPHLDSLKKAMEYNLFLEKSNGAALALDAVNNCIVLNYRENINTLDVTDFENVLVNFLSTLNNIDLTPAPLLAGDAITNPSFDFLRV